MSDRYVVVGVTGYAIVPGRGALGGNARMLTTYSVLDRDYCHREVFRVTPTAGNAPDERRKRLADERCAALNAEEREWQSA